MKKIINPKTTSDKRKGKKWGSKFATALIVILGMDGQRYNTYIMQRNY